MANYAARHRRAKDDEVCLAKAMSPFDTLCFNCHKKIVIIDLHKKNDLGREFTR